MHIRRITDKVKKPAESILYHYILLID